MGAPPGPRRIPTPPGRPIGRPGMAPPVRMSRRGCAPGAAADRGSYCTRRGTGAPAGRAAAGAGIGARGRLAEVSIPVRGGLDGLGLRGGDAGSGSTGRAAAGEASGSGRRAEGGADDVSGGENVAGAPTSSVGAGSDLGDDAGTADWRGVTRG